MAANKGSLMLLKLGGAGTSGTTVGQLLTTSFTSNGEAVDVTNKDSAGYRTLLAGAGVASLSISAEGYLDGTTTVGTLMGYVTAQSLNTFGLEFNSTDTIVGSFQLTSMGSSGGHNDAQRYTLSLESSGQWTTTVS